MPRPKRRKYTRHYDRFADGYAFRLSPEIKKSILILGLLAVGGISFLSLFGLAGIVGDYVNAGLALMFGWTRAVVPILLIAAGFLLYNEDKKWVHGYTYVGLFFFLLSTLSLFHIFFSDPERTAALGQGGGYTGLFLVKIFISLIGFWASLLILLCLFAISLMLMFNTTLSGLMGADGIFRALLAPFRFVWSRVSGRGGEDEDEEEEDAETDYEEAADELSGAAEYEEGEPDEQFSSRALGGAAAEATTEDTEELKPRRSNIKIKLPLDLLSSQIGRPSGADAKTCSEIIKRTMENFGIPVEMGEVSVGPTVTQYTFKPAEGVKLTRITGLGNDLALSLAMHPIRIEAPIPGRSLVGVEVPNRIIARVGLREILDTRQFRKREASTMLALGKDVAGTGWLANLAKMPHLLVAGATGSGKSVCLNTIIVSLLYQNNPDDLKFIMVDPKRVELPVYNGIPYLLTPVITDVPKTINALKWCLGEMDRRFDVLAAAGKRNIESYNASAGDKLPYLVFIIDELADLMVAAARDVEGAIIRIAQMARAVGIHLILATQRPSVDVLTGLIKANVPARIAFSVASSIDSRTILDTQGAEKLLGRGDMLFLSSDMSKPKRIQGAYIDEREIKKIVNYIKDRAGEAEYTEEITGRQKLSGVAGAGFNDDDSDELYEEAKEIVINTGKASTSYLQRRLRVGYARAARLIDLLEEGGIIGPGNGAKPREILISQDEYAKVSEAGTAGPPRLGPPRRASGPLRRSFSEASETGEAGVPVHNRDESRFDSATVFGDDEEDDTAAEKDAASDEEGEEDDVTEGEEAEDDEDEDDADGDDLPPVVDVNEGNNDEEDDDGESEEEMEKLYSR